MPTEKKRPRPSEPGSRTNARAQQDNMTPIEDDDEDDVAVDALASEALNDAPEPNIGHFGRFE